MPGPLSDRFLATIQFLSLGPSTARSKNTLHHRTDTNTRMNNTHKILKIDGYFHQCRCKTTSAAEQHVQWHCPLVCITVSESLKALSPLTLSHHVAVGYLNLSVPPGTQITASLLVCEVIGLRFSAS